eukprot:c19062_g1_i4 orf=80-976(+)
MAPFLFFVTILVAATYTEAKSTVLRTVSLHYPALYPESLAWDEELGLFISGSLARGALFSITENGTVDEFIRDTDYSGISATVGLTVDAPRRRVLAVVNNVFEHPSSFHALASYNLDTKARLFLAKFDGAACPNDVAVDPTSGFAYVTDSARDVIFKVSPSDGISIRQDGLLIVVSTDVLWVVKSRDNWRSAYIVEEVDLNRSLNSTTVALRGPKDDAVIIHAHFQDLFTVAEKGMAGLPGGEFRTDFSFQEIKLPDDPDNNPLWLLVIVVAILVMFGAYKLQMKLLLDKYNRSIKRD